MRLLKKRKRWILLLLLIPAVILSDDSLARTPQVAVTLKPIHSIVSCLMTGVGTPHLLLPDGASPHTFQLKPSTLKNLQEADLVIWVGPSLELFMIKPLQQIPGEHLITLIDIPALHLLPLRRGRQWQHSHSDETHPHPAPSNSPQNIDPHFWLSSQNGKILVGSLAKDLAKQDPEHAEIYQINAKKCIQHIEETRVKLQALFASIQQQPFLVYHDGYQYFEQEFNLHAVGTMITNPHLPLSAHGLNTIKQLIKKNNIKCVFRETEFNDSVILNSLSGLNIRVAELDPLGTRLPPGPDNYPQTLLEIGETMHQCLSP